MAQTRLRKARSGPSPWLLAALGVIVALIATNPDEARLREAMRDQQDLKLDAASLLPIERENFVLFSRLTLKYGIGQKVCWGAAYTVFVCP